MTEEEILAIVEELEAYGNKGPSISRKTCLKAAELIRDLTIGIGQEGRG